MIAKRLYHAYIADEVELKRTNNAIEYGILWGRLANPLWATERYLTLGSAHPHVERYKSIAELGIKDSEQFFKLPFEHWFQYE